ncbi:hypothetical protein F4777DRAFT_576024 [Nemania sp. FL0916]|nr:hypothetical protein F4777DRAFT_576024 [Nemania sp. FL0916]
MDTGVSSKASNESYPLQSESLVCSKCSTKYPNIHELLTHQKANKHFACNQCEMCFWTDDGLFDHKRKNHRPDLDLECFGCQFHFGTAAQFWQHLEGDECKVICPSDITRLREKRLGFAEQLELRKEAIADDIQFGELHINEEDTWAADSERDMPANPVVPGNSSRAAYAPRKSAHPLYYRSEDFPVLHSKSRAPPTFSSHEKQKENVGPNQKATFSEEANGKPSPDNTGAPPPHNTSPSYASDRPTPGPINNSSIQTIKAPTDVLEVGPHSTTSSGPVVDPNDPDYIPAVFHNAILRKYVCPYKRCGKKLPSAHALTEHLRSPAHSGRLISCVCCQKEFASVAKLISHMECATKCQIRETDCFRRVLGQLTGGILDFHCRSDMFIIDQNSVQELFRLRSGSALQPKNAGKSDQGEQVDNGFW